jgi:hypothetical protein
MKSRDTEGKKKKEKAVPNDDPILFAGSEGGEPHVQVVTRAVDAVQQIAGDARVAAVR